MMDLVPVERTEALGDGRVDEVDVQWQVAECTDRAENVKSEKSGLGGLIVCQDGAELHSISDETGHNKHWRIMLVKWTK